MSDQVHTSDSKDKKQNDATHCFHKDPCMGYDILGSREKKTKVFFTEKNTIRVSAYLNDSYHEIELQAEFSHPDLTILDMKLSGKRFPHSVCWHGAKTVLCMKGEKVAPGIMKKLAEKVGNKGCYHVNALFREVIECAIWGRGLRIRSVLKELYPQISYLQLYKIGLRFRPELIDSCRAYDSGGDLIKGIERVSIPKEIDFQTIEELEKAYHILNRKLMK